MKILSFVIQKGGTGKTTTAVMLSAILAERGYRTLILDLDPQANATECLIDPQEVKASIRDVILGGKDLQSVIVTSRDINNLDFVPAVPSMLIDEYFGRFSGIIPHLLSNEIESLKKSIGDDYYKYVFFDCPPNLLHFTKNALFASDYVVVPMEPEPLALDGLFRFTADVLPDILTRNKNLKIGGVILIHRSQRTRKYIPEQVRSEIDRRFGPQIRFKVEIPLDQNLTLMRDYNKPALCYARTSQGCTYYEALADEFIARIPP